MRVRPRTPVTARGWSIADVVLLRDRSLHHVLLIGFLVVLPLNSELVGPVVGVGKPALLAALLGSLILSSLHRDRARGRVLQPDGLTWAALIGYAAVVAGSMTLHRAPSDDWFQYAAIPVSLLALWVSERTHPGSFLRALVFSAIFHLGFALVLGHREVGTSGADRLTGGSHPITLGIEAGLVFCFAVALWLTGRLRAFAALVGVLAVWVLFQSLSRTAIIATIAALVLLLVTHRTRDIGPRILVVVGLGPLAAYFLLDDFITALVGRGDLQGFLTATGRFTIWNRILAAVGDYALTGFGWAPLHTPDGPDARLFRATAGLPAENSFLAAFLMAGAAGLILFVLVFVRALAVSLRWAGTTTGASGALVTICFAVAMLGDGSAGLSNQWWWLIGLFSLANAAACAGPAAAPPEET